ncbi:cupin domain-containing protein [Pseudomonas veronii]|uniref:Cupin domain-containing protein n=1 Tax=Pseudomonas veronii TaxID=76761 RepID=A0A7Y1F5W2_PSEVE|nr:MULTISPECIES: cupin domain-containing protein [Pseudomonas]NMX53045.1 cupin domain-containing protein [Pseudomonas veronii]NMY00162.1 cupin domain-containing protein [Pseudomonas veronii]QPO20145.1 cupin domain-containing protein [Pseudomonas sp. Y39-6]URS63307.1 cupin domain-containing protein [Pseudomonas sp. Y39-6]
MKVIHGNASGAVSEQRSSTFTGVVWADPVMPTTDGVTINNVSFTPGARTFWHSHEQGQVLYVSAGSGWICIEGREPEVIRQGDTVWIGPHERHWHGANTTHFMVHLATSIGKTVWEEAVSDQDYLRAVR